MKKAIGIFQTISILIGFVAIILFFIPTIIGIKPFIVLSGSMESTIKTGAVAYINTHVKAQDIQVGDIIAFKVDKSFVTHRVISINDDNTFTTKGDANQTEDLAPVKFEEFGGKTIFSLPYLGYLLQSMQTRTGIFILLTTVGLNVVLLIFLSEDKEKEQEEKTKGEKGDKAKEKAEVL